MKKASTGMTILGILILIALGIGAYFLFFSGPCSGDQIYNPYSEICVGKQILCNLDSDCLLLEGQTVSFTGETLAFTLVSAEELGGTDRARISINGQEVELMNQADAFSFGDYNILLESADGDADKIMGASIIVTKN